MSTWNYRILNDGNNWWISEVYYDNEGKPEGYIESAESLSNWSRQEDLVTTHRLMGFALDKPFLRVAADGSLTENLA
jgi:hypothetical protein